MAARKKYTVKQYEKDIEKIEKQEEKLSQKKRNLLDSLEVGRTFPYTKSGSEKRTKAYYEKERKGSKHVPLKKVRLRKGKDK